MTRRNPFFLLPSKVYYVVTPLLALLIISTYPNRVLHFDDAWNAEQAYRLWHDGYVHSSFFATPQVPPSPLLIYHKAFIYAQAPVAGLLGFGVYAVKATALLFTLATLALLLRYFRAAPAEARWLAAFLFLGCGTVLEYSFVNRAETMVMACGLASYLLLRRRRPAWAGALAALAALAHLNGTIYLIAGALWLLWNRAGWRPLLWFAGVGTVVGSLYFADALWYGQLPLLFQQFAQAPITQGNLHGSQKLDIMLSYAKVFLHSESQVALTALFVISLVVSNIYSVRGWRWPQALRYLLLLLGAFWLLTARPAAYYFLLFVPFIIIVIVELTLAAAPRWRPAVRVAWLVLLALYPVGSVARAIMLWDASRPESVAAENARLAAYMPRAGSRAVVPLSFFFGQASRYRSRSLTYYALLNDADYAGQLPVPDFFRLLAQDSVQYLVTDHTGNQAYQVPPDAPARIGQYQRVYKGQWHSVYARQPEQPHFQ